MSCSNRGNNSLERYRIIKMMRALAYKYVGALCAYISRIFEVLIFVGKIYVRRKENVYDKISGL